MPSFWWRPFLYVAGAALLSLALSTKLGSHLAWGLFSLGLCLYLIYHLRQLRKLTHWLDKGDRPPLQGDGLWGDALYRLERLLRTRLGAQQKAAADLERMLEATRRLPDGVVILDTNNRILWLNDAAERMFALSPSRDQGQFIHYLLRNSRFGEWLMNEDFSQTLTLASPTHPEKSISLQLVPLQHQQKMLLARDITELARVEAMRRDFVANVSHELRTPITVIVGFLEAFDDMPDPDPAQFRKHIPLMREQSDRIRRLVDDLLTLARLESEPETKDEAVDLPALAQRLRDEATTMSQGKHEITLELRGNARLIGNSQELYSALANLVSNAVRYTPAGGHITLRWQPCDHGGMAFSVTDTGEGIEPQHIPRLTERFYRVDRGRSRATGGTGLGLAIVKHILQRHQARLRIDSTVGKGSTFSAIFPVERVIPESAKDSDALPGARRAAL